MSKAELNEILQIIDSQFIINLNYYGKDQVHIAIPEKTILLFMLK